jgi:cytochrome b subunit of formate dehydrogenase
MAAQAEVRAGAGPEAVPLVYRRFSAFHRFCHYLVMISFFGLVLTGMSLKFKTGFWAKLLVNAVGGVAAAGFIHRVMAVISILYYVLEVGYAVWYVIRRKGPVFGPDSIVPSKKDAQDIRDMFKWFFGKGSRPRFNRYAYWEKFDYWALFAGTVLIGGSGLMLWFPEATTRILPGLALNVAYVIHSNEALLATGVIFIFVHFFSAHARPEIFPAETNIFSGYNTVEEYIVERPMEYEARVKAGTLDQVLRPAPSRRVRGFYRALTGVVVVVAFLCAVYTLLLMLWPVFF